MKLSDKLFPYWFYPSLVLAILVCLGIAFALLWGVWELFQVGFYWLVAR